MRDDSSRDATGKCIADLEESLKKLRESASESQSELVRELEQIVAEIRQSTRS